MELNANYWNDRWLANQTGWDMGQPSPALVEYTEQLKDKNIRILIPGAGNAYEAEYLHQKGFSHVFPMDFAPEAKNQFLQRVPDFPADHFLVGDFFELNDRFDLILEQTFYCAIDPTLRDDYVNHMHRLLNEGGKLVGLLWDAPMFSDHPPYGGNKAEYQARFSPKFHLKTLETAYNSIPPRAGKEAFFIAEKK